MTWNTPATELTTAATDALLAVLALWCIAVLRRTGSSDSWKRAVWSWMFGLLAAGAVFGAIVHGFAWAESIRSLLWMPLYLSLGFAVALFAVGAVHDGFGRRTSGRALPFVLAAAVGFFIVTQVGSGNFLWFVIYESTVMVAALAIYAFLWLARRAPGAGWMTIGIALTILAAAVQAGKRAQITLIWPVNHDGIFHLIQMVGMMALLRGIRGGPATSAVHTGVDPGAGPEPKPRRA